MYMTTCTCICRCCSTLVTCTCTCVYCIAFTSITCSVSCTCCLSDYLPAKSTHTVHVVMLHVLYDVC